MQGTIPGIITSSPEHGSVASELSPFVDQAALSGSDELHRQHGADLAIPHRHSTTPQNMLFWPCCPVRFHSQDIRYPLNVEVHRISLPPIAIPPKALITSPQSHHWFDGLSFLQFRSLATPYFTHYHPRCMILDEHEVYERTAAQDLLSGLQHTLNHCLVLLVLAIGSVAAAESGDDSWLPSRQDEPSTVNSFEGTGLGFFTLAQSIFAECRNVSWLSVQCLLLSACYYSLQLRVYDQWQAVNQACMTVMLLLQMDPSPTSFQCQLYWVAYLQESQILAELEFPPSGISRLENRIPLPFAAAEERNDPQKAYQFFFLAEIALRRLLNRVHSHLYRLDIMEVSASNPPTTPPAASSLIMYELDHQLEIWRDHLPESLKFDTQADPSLLIGPEVSRTMHEKLVGTLKTRYFAAKAIIFRPFAYKVLHNDDATTPTDDDIAGAKISLESALQVPLQAGLLCDNLRLVPLLLNPSRR